MAIMILYASIMLMIALPGLRRIKSVESFVTGGRPFGSLLIAASLVATVIGASSTLGMAALARTYGGAAFWWLGLGAVGLVLMAWLTARPLWDLKALSIADAVSKLVGRRAGQLTGAMIVIAWTGIIAAQLVAIGAVVSGLTEAGEEPLIMLAGLAVTAYTAIGGQRGVVRTDLIQLVILTAGVLAAFCILLPGSSEGGMVMQPLVHEGFNLTKLLMMALPLLGAFAVGPDMFSRINTARSLRAARRGLLIASVIIVGFGIVITSLALLALDLPPEGRLDNPLLGALVAALPSGLATLFILGLVSAMISSADTCLLTAGSIFGCTLVQAQSLGRVRAYVSLTGIMATLLALFFRDIIGLMISSYAVYTAGIAAPLVVVLVASAHQKRPHPTWFVAAMTSGGICGIISVVLALPSFVLWGTISSAVLALVSLKFGWRDKVHPIND